MEQYVLGGCPLFWDLLEHHLHDIDGLLRGCVLVLDFLIELLHGVEVADLVSLERHVAVEHGVEADAGAPDVHRESLVAHVLDDFRGDVRRRTALLEEDLLLLDLSADTEVSDLDVAVPVQQDVVKLDVAVHDELALMNVVEAGDHLLEQVLGIVFLELTTLSNVAEQIASLAQFHHEAHMFTRFK